MSQSEAEASSLLEDEKKDDELLNRNDDEHMDDDNDYEHKENEEDDEENDDDDEDQDDQLDDDDEDQGDDDEDQGNENEDGEDDDDQDEDDQDEDDQDEDDQDEDDQDEDDQDENEDEDDDDEEDDDSSSEDDEEEEDQEGGLSALERRRLERIKRNQERLAKLGLEDHKPKARPKQKPKKEKRQIDPSELRKSSRTTKKAVNYAELPPKFARGRPEIVKKPKPKDERIYKTKEPRLERFIYDEFRRLEAQKRHAIKAAVKKAKYADIEHRFMARRVGLKEKKASKKDVDERTSAVWELERKAFGCTMKELMHEADRRHGELSDALKQFGESAMTPAQIAQQEKKRLEQERKMEMIDAMNRFPTAVKDAVHNLNVILLERSPRDTAPPRRGKRKRGEDESVEGTPTNISNSDIVSPDSKQKVTTEWDGLAAAIASGRPGNIGENPFDDEDGDADDEPKRGKGSKKSRKKARNVGGWVSPMFAEEIDRSWLDGDKYDADIDLSKYVPQVGDIVLYYPSGHRSFLKSHPDILGRKTRSKTRVPLWERAQKEKEKSSQPEKCAKQESKNQEDEMTQVPDVTTELSMQSQLQQASSWWSDEWLAGVEGELGNYPLVCRVDRTQIEFPPDPDTESTLVKDEQGGVPLMIFQKPKPGAHAKKRHERGRQSLCLAITLRPLTPLVPPVWEAQQVAPADGEDVLDPPPMFQVVTSPSKSSPFIIPFSIGYRAFHSMHLEEKTKLAKDLQWRGIVKSFATVGEKYGSFRLNDKVPYVRSILSHLKGAGAAPTSILEKSLVLSSSQKTPSLPLADTGVVIERMADAVDSLGFNGGDLPSFHVEGSLVTLIRSTLPLWESVSVVRDDRKPSSVSAWELLPIKGVLKNAESCLHTALTQGTLADNGLMYHIDEALRAKLECALEDFTENNEESHVFWDPVTDDFAPSYSCAVPLGMCFEKILRRLSCRSSATDSRRRCYYRSVDAILSDIGAILENSLLYNSPESAIVDQGTRVIREAKSLIEQVAVHHQKEVSLREKADEARKKKIQLQLVSSAIVHLDSSYENVSEGKSSSRRQSVKAGELGQTPFLEPLERKWIEEAHPDSSWPIKGAKKSPNACVWIPQSGDFVLYSRLQHSLFVKGHHESLTTQQCMLPQFVIDKKSTPDGSNLGHEASIKPDETEPSSAPTVPAAEVDRVAPSSSEAPNDISFENETLNSHWLLGKIVWVRRAFPRAPPKNGSDVTNTFESLSPVLSIGLCFDYEWCSDHQIHTIHWRPCRIGCTDPNSVCSICACQTQYGFLLPSWMYPSAQNSWFSDRPILFPHQVSLESEAHFGQPTGVSRDDVSSINRCFNLLKRRCLKGIPPDFVDDKFTITNIKQGWYPSNKLGNKALPNFESIIGVDAIASSDQERSSNRQVANQRVWSNKEDISEALPLLADFHFLPPFVQAQITPKSNTKETPNKHKCPSYEETMSPSPNLCLELVQQRLKNSYYRQRDAIIDDLQEAYAMTTLLVLSKQANKKFSDLSIRRIAKALCSYAPVRNPFQKKPKKKSDSADDGGNKKGPSQNEEEEKWTEKIRLVRSLYSMALVSVTDTVFFERVMGTVPKVPLPEIPKGDPALTTRQNLRMAARQKIVRLLSALGRDPCRNRGKKKQLRNATINGNEDTNIFPPMKVKITGRSLFSSGEELGPILFNPQDYTCSGNGSEGLVRCFFGRPGRMGPCARCQAYRRSMLVCRVQRGHSNKDFNWFEKMKDTGGIDGLLYTFRTGDPFTKNLRTGPSDDSKAPVPTAEASAAQAREVAQVEKDMLEKSKLAIKLAEKLIDKTRKESKAPHRLSDEFISTSFPIDPTDGHYNYCSICGFSGDVICCEKCPVVMHPKCFGLAEVPEDDWFCPKCAVSKEVMTPNRPKDSQNKENTVTNLKSMVQNQPDSGSPVADEGASAEWLEKQLDEILTELRNYRHGMRPPRYKKKVGQDFSGVESQIDEIGETGKSAEDPENAGSKNSEVVEQDGVSLRPRRGRPRKDVVSAIAHNPEKRTKTVKQKKRGRPKKQRETSPVVIEEPDDESLQPIGVGSKISKEFGKQGFFMGVVKTRPAEGYPFYSVLYEDGDEEDMTEAEVRKHLIFRKPPRKKIERGRSYTGYGEEQPNKRRRQSSTRPTRSVGSVLESLSPETERSSTQNAAARRHVSDDSDVLYLDGKVAKTPHEKRWMENYNLLKEFKSEYGHLKVPISYDAVLSRWVGNQRLLLKDRSGYRGLRVDALDSLEFDWGTTHPLRKSSKALTKVKTSSRKREQGQDRVHEIEETSAGEAPPDEPKNSPPRKRRRRRPL